MDTNGHQNQITQISHPPELTLTPGDGLEPKPSDTWHGIDLKHDSKLRGVIKRLTEWYQRGAGALILAGDPGCGKTHLAKVAYELYGGPAFVLDWSVTPVESVRNAVFYAEPELFTDIKQSYGKNQQQTEGEIIRVCQKARLLILDDLGVAHIKDESLPWAQDIYWRIFDARADKFTLITTNLTSYQWGARIGRRAISRLMQALGNEKNIVEMFGIPDYRQKNWRTK